MSIKVKNITEDELQKFYEDITVQLAQKHIDTTPLAVIGVANNGIDVSKGIAKQLQKSYFTDVRVSTIVCRRPHSRHMDQNFLFQKLKKYLLKMPGFFLNGLRLVEHYVLSSMRPSQREVILSDDFDMLLAQDVFLIVDDAVDSGHSMKAVVDEMHRLLKNKTLYTIAVVTTQKKPVFDVDFCQYREVLVRFPWSVDKA
ncbi:MAG: phosphoribosyltransferase family protein [Bdellovibrionota bacterium]